MKRIEKSYAFDDDEAVARLEALGDFWRKRHGVLAEWSGNTVRLVGRKLGVRYDARVTVSGGKVVVEVEVGFLAEKLGGHDYVERKVDEYLDPATSLESLRGRIRG